MNLLVQRARQGDESVLPELRHFLDARPQLWQHYGDVAAHAREAWVRVIAGDDLALREATARKAEDMARELAGPEPTVVERLLAERAVLCWLQLAHADTLAAQSLSQSRQLAVFWAKRQAGAHRRYLTSLAALVTLRRLLPCTSGGALDASRPDSSFAVSERDDVRQVDPEHRLRIVGNSK